MAVVVLAINLLKEQELTLAVVSPVLEEAEFTATTAVQTIVTSVLAPEEG